MLNATPDPVAQSALFIPSAIGVVALSGVVAPGIRIALVVRAIVVVYAYSGIVVTAPEEARVAGACVVVVAVKAVSALARRPFGLTAPHQRNHAQPAET
jgi:hypothetical protein